MSAIPPDMLTDAELDELDRFLIEAEGVDEPMDISMLDGYFAALLSGPTTILPSERMRWVGDIEKGEDTPVFSSTAQAQHIMGLMMRHMNDVAGTLLEAPEDYEPLILENRDQGDPVPVIRREPLRNPAKVGRNEPCPCGSGKKYKHCHGAAPRLH
jgi:uncharacterized protein